MVIIKNGTIVDGTGRPAFKADVLISGDKISAIGSFPNKKADMVIDALGMHVTPGFIDINNDSDHHLTLFTNPEQGDFLLQGITTIIGGHCGASLAPLLYGSLESIRKWADTGNFNVGWQWMGELFALLKRGGVLGVNFGTLVGHSTLRRAIIGEDQRDLTDRELSVLVSLVERSLKEGALGFSTGLGYAHSRLVPYSEIRTIAQTVRKYNGIYSTHVRDDKERLVEAVQEAANIAKETSIPTIISHFRPLIGYERQMQEALLFLRGADEALDLSFDVFPFDSSLVPIYTLLPAWARRGNLEHMREQLLLPRERQRVVDALANIKPENITVAKAPGNPYLIGKTIPEIAANQGISASEALVRLMLMTKLKSLVLVKDIDLGLAEEMIFEPRALIATNSASMPQNEEALAPERATRTFPRFLELALSRQRITIEEAVKKVTSVPAKKLRLGGRGVLKEGAFADVVCIEKNHPTHVLVNGKLAVHHKTAQHAKAGYILKRQ